MVPITVLRLRAQAHLGRLRYTLLKEGLPSHVNLHYILPCRILTTEEARMPVICLVMLLSLLPLLFPHRVPLNSTTNPNSNTETNLPVIPLSTTPLPLTKVFHRI